MTVHEGGGLGGEGGGGEGGGEARAVAGGRARYLLDDFIYVLHALNGLRTTQVDRPLGVLSGTAPARLLGLDATSLCE